ncbi:MAG: hypothetical protein ACQEW0_16350 [Pseudomonadota bacterium]
MRIKITVLSVAAVLLAFATSAQATPGRYQLVDSSYQFINIDGEEFQEQVLILLDTSTGQMKVCSSGQYPGKVLGRDNDKDYQVRGCNEDFELTMELPNF